MKKYTIFGILLVALIILGFTFLINFNKNNAKEKTDNSIDNLSEVKSHYNKYVKTSREAKLYYKTDDNYKEYGKISENINLILDDIELTSTTTYFKIENLDIYVYYRDVEKIDAFSIDDRYKNYIYFNQNIKTKDVTSFYDYEGNLLYTINSSFDFPIIVKDDNRYGIEYNNALVYINSEDIESIYDNINTELKNKDKIRTLTYHFLYNPDTYNCDQAICQTLDQFESHLKYIRENNYFTLKLNELEMYLDGKINIPEKSIVLTIDDGTIFDLDAIKLLEQYKVNATLFVITGIKDTYDEFKSEYLDLESHTNNMHNQYECKGYGNQGGGILCLDEDKVLEDLRISQEKLGGSKYFAYPFFDFNDRAISLLKKAGFKLAFIGQYNTYGYSYPKSTDKYKVRRMTIFSSTTMDEFISYLK